MILRNFLKILLLAAVFLLTHCTRQDDFPDLKGPYLGRKLPGNIPEPFSSIIDSTISIQSIPLFSQEGNFLVFKGTVASANGVFWMENKKDVWSYPRKILSLSPYEDRHFFLTADMKKLTFTSRRPVAPGTRQTEHPNIWVLEKSSDGWSDLRILDFPVNTSQAEFYSTVSLDGTLYFTRSLDGETCDIYCIRWENEAFTELERLDEPVNTPFVDGDPFIAPDESYMIFLSNRPGGLGQHDFYISYQIKDGTWTQPVHLGDRICSEGNDVCPLVTPDGRFFFFGSNRNGTYDVYWVAAQFIEELRPEALK